MATINGKLNKTVKGTKGDDTIFLNGKADAYGGKGNDSITGSTGPNKIYGEDGDDFIATGGGTDSAWGGRGNDQIAAYSENAPVKLYGQDGNDYLHGSKGNDFIDGGAGNDWMNGYAGADSLRGGAGNDFFYFDTLYDNDHGTRDTVSGGAGHDTIYIEADYVYGNPLGRVVDIRITGKSAGTVGFSQDVGGSGYVEKIVFAGTNEFWMDHDDESTLVYHGGDSDNTVTGGNVDDIFYSGVGNETFFGYDGNDTFYFNLGQAPVPGNDTIMGHDTILDFQDPQSGIPAFGLDKIVFIGNAADYRVEEIEYRNEIPDPPIPGIPPGGVTVEQGTNVSVYRVADNALIHTLHLPDAVNLADFAFV
jgi:Ca2+-binding RTX toxin-like protein